MDELVNKLNYYTELYDAGTPAISDEEWDNMYFQLVQMETEAGYALPNSPTQSIYFKVVDELEKVTHNHKMLSLAKTKDIEEVKRFIGDQPFVCMAKMDGLTCSLHYENHVLVSAETRGNGYVGENILHNIVHCAGVPRLIESQEAVIDGEIICTYEDFEPFKDQYKNPRNFASGSIRLLNSEESAKRHLTFVAWDFIEGEEFTSFVSKLVRLEELGFIPVPYTINNFDPEVIKVSSSFRGYPIDGCVFKFDDIVYGQSLGETAHHFNNAIAYKFYDEKYPTRLLDVEYSMGRTGILTPVAIFETVEIDGTEVNRASLHNLNIMQEIFDRPPYKYEPIEVTKQNMIIPQVVAAYPEEGEHENLYIPLYCPVCGDPLKITESDFLMCDNPDCDGKLINRINHFFGKKGLDIKGISLATIEKLIDYGWIDNLEDIFKLKSHRDEWVRKPGFGARSVDNILKAIDDGRTTTFEKFLSAIGIPLIGTTMAKEIVKVIPTYEEFRDKVKNHYNFSLINGIAVEKWNNIINFDYTEADKIYSDYIVIQAPTPIGNGVAMLDGITVVITGGLKHYKNRDALAADIVSHGGKVVGSVSKNTNYLICNDTNSTSSKAIKARNLGILIISEEDFIEKFFDK